MISRGRWSPGGQRRIQARGEHVGAHHHARAAAGRRVVDRAMAPEAMLANIERLAGPQPARERVAGEAWPSGPGNICGNSVSRVAANMAAF